MLKVVDGNLLTSDCDVIIHQANCFGKMGAGIAKQIVKKYPEAGKADLGFSVPVGGKDRLGKYSSYTAPNGVTIVNMYSQYHWGRGKKQTSYSDMKQALTSILKEVEGNKIGVPFKIGCGLAGGDWRIVSKLIDDVSTELRKEVYAYKL